MLGEIPQLHGVPQGHRAGVRGQVPGNQVQKGGFPRAVAPYNAHPVGALEQKIKILQHPFSAEGLAHLLQLHGFLAQPGGHGPDGFQGAFRLRRLKGLQLFVPFQPLPAFGAPGAGALEHPLELPAQGSLTLALPGGVHFLPAGLAVQVGGVAALVAVDFSQTHFQGPVCHPFQKIPVVGHQQDSTGEALKIAFQPADHFRIQMVGGLIQEQQIRRMHQAGGQSHPLALPAGEGAHLLLQVRDAQPGEDFHGFVPGNLPGGGIQSRLHLLHDGILRVKGRILREVSQPHVGIVGYPAGIRRFLPGGQLQKGGFPPPLTPTTPTRSPSFI